MKYFLLYSGLIFLADSCQLAPQPPQADKLLAKVHNKSLYLSELDEMFPVNATHNDSMIIITGYVERWVRDALLLYEAEQNIPSDLNIDKLVRDYRASLIRHNYEEVLVERFLDSTITKDELMAFYEQHKENYQLETPIVRCHLIKVPYPVPQGNKLRDLWNRTSDSLAFKELIQYCNQFAEAHLLEDSTWHNVDDIAAELPPGAVSPENLTAKRNFSLQEGGFEYYFKVIEVKNRKEIAPLSYIETQARRTILHNRKTKLLEQKKEEIYDLEMRKDNIKIHF